MFKLCKCYNRHCMSIIVQNVVIDQVKLSIKKLEWKINNNNRIMQSQRTQNADKCFISLHRTLCICLAPTSPHGLPTNCTCTSAM